MKNESKDIDESILNEFIMDLFSCFSCLNFNFSINFPSMSPLSSNLEDVEIYEAVHFTLFNLHPTEIRKFA